MTFKRQRKRSHLERQMARDEAGALVLARLSPQIIVLTGQMLEKGMSAETIVALAQQGGADPQLLPALQCAIRYIQRQLAKR